MKAKDERHQNARPMTPQESKLQGLMSASIECAKRLQLCANLSQLFAAIFALSSVMVDAGVVRVVLTWIGIVGILGRYAFGLAVSWPRGRGERCRRRLLVSYGLRDESSEETLKDAIAEFHKPDVGLQFERSEWFTTRQQPGPAAFLEAMWENAFFTHRMYSHAGWWFTWVSAAFVALLLLLLPLVASWVDGNAWHIVVQVLAVLIGVVITLDLVGQAIRFHRAAVAMSRIEAESRRLKVNVQTTVKVLELFGDYNAVVEAAPLTPSMIWRLYRDSIRRAWDERHQ
ncbi:MAG: hypothetical protein HUU19_07845 [Phycisphaerales bacterium]|nr:hypothetical protein [Phycisphaerales bacterium]